MTGTSALNRRAVCSLRAEYTHDTVVYEKCSVVEHTLSRTDNSQSADAGDIGGSTKSNNPLENIEYTDKVKKQMQLGDYHSFPESVDAFGSDGKVTDLFGGDEITRTKIEISGSYDGKDGVFQYIIEPDGITCNHRDFVPSW